MTIKEVSEKYDLSADTIRYYERIGLIPHVPRKENGIRDFDEAACGWVEFSKCMRSAGVQVEALIEYVDLFFKEGTEEARKDILVEQRARLQEQYEQLKATMERLDYKIAHYEELMGKKCPNLKA
ncbi:MAG: MerR family transcriptional regulator [Selenomonas ruminantium]|uniref:MerR family transcriptional regulator n=1 Tax=Selenomonas ruminantium TaxID=971 RepID=A0A927ZVC8_SELRU|nr:MerR family transcriptional regulator [Selenomonas ruminantium]